MNKDEIINQWKEFITNYIDMRENNPLDPTDYFSVNNYYGIMNVLKRVILKEYYSNNSFDTKWIDDFMFCCKSLNVSKENGQIIYEEIQDRIIEIYDNPELIL